MVPFSFGDQALFALAQGAVFWPARRALLVADLHLEKGSWYATRGQMLPPYDTLATLADLEALVVATGADELWCLGDSFHDREGCARLPVAARDTLIRLTSAVAWTWITGNHDPVIADRCGGDLAAEVVVDGLVLRHEADPVEPTRGTVGPFSSQAAADRARQAGGAALFRGDRPQADPARVRRADRRDGPGPPGDPARGRHAGRGAGAG